MTPFNFNTGNYFINITFLSILEMSLSVHPVEKQHDMTEKRIFPARPFNDRTPTPAKRRQISSFSSNRCGRPFQEYGEIITSVPYTGIDQKFLHSRKGQACIDCRILYSDKRPEHTERPVWRHQLLSRLLQGNGVHGRI